MHMTYFKISIALIAVALIGAAGVWWYMDTSSDEEAPDVAITAEYDTKVVYDLQADEAAARNDCSARGGTFNACGSGCAPDAAICTQVCTPVCTLETERGYTDVPEEWRAFSHDETQLQFQAPLAAEMSTEAGRVKVQLLGLNNEPNTEVTDGITLTAMVETADDDAVVRVQAETALATQENAPAGGEVLEPLHTIPFGDRIAYAFTVRSALGNPVTYVFVRDAADRVILRATYAVSDPRDVGYENTARTIIGTLTYRDSGDAPVHERVSLAVLDTERVTDGKERGCDYVTFISRDVAPTTAPLTAALQELFVIDQERIGGHFHFLARTNDTLSFDRVTITDGMARVYLTGELSGLAGVCDNPRARIQIEETALQYETVSDVEIYLNGEVTDLTPDGRGVE